MILNRRIPLSYPFHLIKMDIFITSVFSITIYLISNHIYPLKLPVTLGAFLGTAITLLLSFKLSQSYDRWWEARKIWGSIVNDSRTLVIQVLSFFQDKKEIKQQIAYRQIAWCYSLGQALRKEDPLNNLEDVLKKEELDAIKKHRNIPLALLQKHSEDIIHLVNQSLINPYQQVQIDTTLSRLTASMGMAERIKNTVFPKSYRLTLRLFIYLFLILLSFSLTELKGIMQVPLLVFIALPFFLLEKIASQMQDPFENKPTDTAMTSIARNIDINIRELLNENELPEPLTTKKFYIL